MTLLKDGEALPGEGFTDPWEKRILQQNKPVREHISLCSFADSNKGSIFYWHFPIFLLKKTFLNVLFKVLVFTFHICVTSLEITLLKNE